MKTPETMSSLSHRRNKTTRIAGAIVLAATGIIINCAGPRRRKSC